MTSANAQATTPPPPPTLTPSPSGSGGFADRRYRVAEILRPESERAREFVEGGESPFRANNRGWLPEACPQSWPGLTPCVSSGHDAAETSGDAAAVTRLCDSMKGVNWVKR